MTDLRDGLRDDLLVRRVLVRLQVVQHQQVGTFQRVGAQNLPPVPRQTHLMPLVPEQPPNQIPRMRRIHANQYACHVHIPFVSAEKPDFRDGDIKARIGK